MAVVVPIVTEYNGRGLNSALKEIGQAEGALGKLSAAGKVVGATFAAAGAAFVAFQGARFIGDSIQAASDLSEALSKNRVIFGQYAQDVTRFSEQAAKNLGQTQVAALNAASTFATFGKSAGLVGGELVGFSTRLTTLASDLASFWNTSTDDAITALGAALRNETEPIRRYGVLINQAALEQKALDLGITQSLGPLTQQQKVLAATELIFEQTKDAQGDFARTQDGLANTTRTLAAAFDNAKASIGSGFVLALDSATESAGGAQGLAGAIESLGDDLGSLSVATGSAIGKLTEFAEELGIVQEATEGTDEANRSLLEFMLDVLPGGMGQATKLWLNYGRAVEDVAANVANAYDSTVRMAQQARQIAAMQAGQKQALVDSAYDSGISRLAEERRIKKLTEILGHVPGQMEEIETASKGASGGVSKLADAADKGQEKFDKFADKVRKSADRLVQAQDDLDAAWAAFNQYADGKANWITGQVNIGAAIEAQITQTMRLAELDRAIVDAFNSGNWEQAATLQAQRAGESAAVNWVDGFRQQIANAKGATTAINQLMATLNPADTAGNKALLDALTTLDPMQAQMAANDLVKRGLGPQIAAELSSLDLFAGATGQSWAGQFYNEGIDAASNQVRGIQDELNRRLNDLYRQGRRMGKAVKDGYQSVVDSLPAGVRGGGLYSDGLLGGPAVNITVNAGHGDPVATARAIQRTLRTAQIRTGR